MGKSRHRHQKALKTKGANHHHNSSSAANQAAESSTNAADGRKNNNQNSGGQHNNNGSNKHNLKGKCFDDLTWEERKKKAENQERDDNQRKLIDRWGRCRSPHNTNSFLFKDVSPTIIGGEDAQNHDGNQETMLNEDIDELLARCQSSPQSSEKVSPPNVDGPSPFSGEKVLSPCPNNSLIPPAKPIATRPTRSTNCNSTRICDQPSVIAVSNPTNSNYLAHEGSAQHNLTHDEVNIQNNNSSPNLNHDPRGGGSCEYMRMSVGVNTSPLLTPGEQQQTYGGHQDYRWKEEEARMGDPLESHPSSSSFDDGLVVARPNTSQAANTGCPTNRPFSPTTPLTSPPIETPAAHGEHPPMAASPECPFFSDSPIARTTAEDPYNTPLVQNSPLNFVSSQKPGQIVSPPLLSPSYRLGSNASPSVKAHIAAATAAAAVLEEEEDAQKRRDTSISPPDTEADWAITSLEAEIEERTKRIRTQQRELERLNALLEARRKESSRRRKRPREEMTEDEGRIRGRGREEEVATEEENGRGSRSEEDVVEEETSKEPEKLPA